jgi:hypothetical protein
MKGVVCNCFVLLAVATISHGLGVPARGQEPDAPRAFVFLVADTADRGLRDHVKEDRDNLAKIFADGFKKRPQRLEMKVFTQAESTPGTIIKVLTQLKQAGKVRPMDTVFFYYSGHGATDKDNGHILKMKSGDLPRSELKKLLEDLQAHNTILITDCCDAPLPPAFMGNPMPSPPPAEWPVLDGLLFQHQGLTDINSCQTGTKAWCYADERGIHRGGVFTLALAKLLCAKPEELSPENELVGWPDFIGHLSITTNDNFQLLLKGKPPIKDLTQRLQVPQAFALGTIKPRRLVDHPWLFGVAAAPVRTGGMYVSGIQPGSPAAAQGLRIADVIESINGNRLRNEVDYVNSIDNSGGQIDLIIIRAGVRISMESIRLQAIKPEPTVPPARP